MKKLKYIITSVLLLGTVASCDSLVGDPDLPIPLEETLENMYAYGIDNVRGSMFSRIKLTNEDKIKAARLYCEMYDLCLNCGSKDH